MKRMLFILLLLGFVTARSQDMRVNFRLDYYMDEPQAEFLVYLPDSTAFDNAQISISTGTFSLIKQPASGQKGIISILVPIANLPQGVTAFTFTVKAAGVDTTGTVELIKRPYKFNAVRVDRKTGGIVTRGMGLIPVGFYCYSPVQPMIQEEEVVRGFNPHCSYPGVKR